MAAELPDEIFLGKQDGEWPIQAFVSEAHALGWLDGGEKTAYRTRRLWKVRIATVTEMTLIPPVPARLTEKDHGDEDRIRDATTEAQDHPAASSPGDHG